MKGWDSTRMIGDVDKAFDDWQDNGSPLLRGVWNAFYNGWLMGRFDMLRQMEEPQETFGSIDKEPFRREE